MNYFFNVSLGIQGFLTKLNLPVLTNSLMYIIGLNANNNIGQNTELFKNQFRPMRKGISNMIRLHATGAIAMPIEIRLHILASSKDIIHS